MDNINISSADFNSSMPKWATEDTMQRLLRFLDREANKGQRENHKLQTLIGKLYENSKNATTIDKSILQELKSLNKTVTSSNKSNKNITSNPTNNKKTEDLLHKTNDLLKKIHNKLPSSNTKQQQQSTSNSTITRPSSGISNVDIGKLQQTIIRSNKDVVTAIKGISTSSSSIKSATTKSEDNYGVGSTKTRIDNTPNKSEGNYGLGSAKTRIDNILNRTTKDISTTSKILGESTSDYTESTAKSKSITSQALKAMGTTSKMVLGMAKFIPIVGGIITAFSSIASLVTIVADQAKRFAWDSQKEYKALLKSGFSFGIETLERGIEMDGIRLQGMINKSGLTIEQGIALMEKNAVLVNNLGVDGVFGTINTVASTITDSGRTFQDQMLLSREEIGNFTTQYLASTMNMVRTEQMSSEQRTKAAQQFIKDARQFGQVTGQGMQEIIDKMTALRKSEDFKLSMLARTDPEDRAMLDRSATFFQSLNLPSHVQDRLVKTLLDTRGLGLSAAEGGAEMRNQLAAIVGNEGTTILDDVVRGIQLGTLSSADFDSQMVKLLGLFEEQNLDINSPQVQAILAGGSQFSKDAVHLITAFQNARKEGLMVDGGIGADQSSRIVNKQQEAETAIARARSEVQRVAIETADRDSSRNLMESSLVLMKSGADVGAKTVGLLGSILGGIVDMASSVVDAIKSLGRIILAGLKKIPGFKTEEEKARADYISGLKGTKDTTLSKEDVYAKVAEEAGLTLNKSGTGFAGSGVNHGHRIRQHAHSLYDKAIQGDAESAEMLRTLASSTNLASNHRNIYLSVIERKLEANEGSQDTIMQRLDATPSTTVGDTAAEAIAQQQQPQQIPSDLQSNTQASPIASETNTIAQQQAAQQAEEQKRIQEEQAAQQRAAQQRAAQPAITTGTTTATENTTQSNINNQQQNQNSQVSVDFGSVNTKLDELIRLQKEFNRNMTIKIIKA